MSSVERLHDLASAFNFLHRFVEYHIGEMRGARNEFVLYAAVVSMLSRRRSYISKGLLRTVEPLFATKNSLDDTKI